MSKLAGLDQMVPPEYSARPFAEVLRKIAQAVNNLSEGRITQHYNGLITAPTTGDWKQGDFVRNTAPVEAGGAGSMYCVLGWVCVASGTPGTWKSVRTLTGN